MNSFSEVKTPNQFNEELIAATIFPAFDYFPYT